MACVFDKTNEELGLEDNCDILKAIKETEDKKRKACLIFKTVVYYPELLVNPDEHLLESIFIAVREFNMEINNVNILIFNFVFQKLTKVINNLPLTYLEICLGSEKLFKLFHSLENVEFKQQNILLDKKNQLVDKYSHLLKKQRYMITDSWDDQLSIFY